ncbi:VOC family protein [Actinoplanes sp. NPDC051343]|uniref:VOC family protein n=1 Tax=Actinoplanes sp. NPDC051343 TaxID=3363906 RepID=UPI0037A2EA7F
MEEVLGRTAASNAVAEQGWRFILGTLRASVAVQSMAQAVDVARRVVDGSDGHLRIDLRPHRVILTLQSAAHAAVTTRDVELAQQISAAVREIGLWTAPAGAQLLEVGIDALDIPAIRPFWKAILGYADEAGNDGPKDPIVDPDGHGPAIWFQQMDEPRPQRNRIHFDVSVPHDEAGERIAAAVDHGGLVVSDSRAPAFWVLSDAEGNEACITTWQGRE